jgi:general secretion pathway protein B
MSLILEALKKSEAERQLGRAPGLTTPMPLFERRPRRFWISGVVLALAAAAGIGLYQWWIGGPSTMHPASEVPAVSPAA